jgi:hypothetical protein
MSTKPNTNPAAVELTETDLDSVLGGGTREQMAGQMMQMLTKIMQQTAQLMKNQQGR